MLDSQQVLAEIDNYLKDSKKYDSTIEILLKEHNVDSQEPLNFDEFIQYYTAFCNKVKIPKLKSQLLQNAYKDVDKEKKQVLMKIDAKLIILSLLKNQRIYFQKSIENAKRQKIKDN